MKRAIDYRATLERTGQLPDLKRALQVACQLKTDAMGRVTLPEGIKREMRDITIRANAREGGNSSPLTLEQQDRVRKLRKEGKSYAEVAQIMGITYHRAYRCGE